MAEFASIELRREGRYETANHMANIAYAEWCGYAPDAADESLSIDELVRRDYMLAGLNGGPR
jgi:hypothetical protein